MTLLRSWVPGANDAGTDFPLNNLPLGVVVPPGGPPRCAAAIGDHVLDVAAAEAAGLIELGGPLLDRADWRPVMEAGAEVRRSLRAQVTALLEEGADRAAERFLLPRAGLTYQLPFAVAEFTDFYAGRHHATNVGTMFRGPENALPPNWDHMPIGYNGRASSVVVSGHGVHRPWGQLAGGDGPRLAQSERFDFELELGCVLGAPSAAGMPRAPISVAEAADCVFGYVLLNDWSARDVQRWEYVPLGPFQSKATATTISPWIVTAEAMAPFLGPPPERAVAPLPYLADAGDAFPDLSLEVALGAREVETVIARTSSRHLWWSFPQMIAHHSSSGCPMRAGDLLGSGTISGPDDGEQGSMLELSWGATREVLLEDGGRRRFLKDGDRVVLRGHARGDGYRVGFGDCAGTVLPAGERPGG
ncbi:fumarylacetoacetase [Jannaschia sp. Os4]|uniref:fumarylacetoacetase n=1 Tax=Jannaschia sp. Os4 TaxID=2807617 RepID=UPI00193A9158|nr:fumarylacetoacetase [Jannaschia sp. Os4]MBM2575325.1 fumarylacetoacetase [Jannaschia sp. Os4]